MDEAVLGAGGVPGAEVRHGERLMARRRPIEAGGGPRRARVSPAVLAVLLIAVLCPVVAASPAAAAGGSIERLPENFSGRLLNNEGAVIGSNFANGTVSLAIYRDGDLTNLPGGNYNRILDFNDADEVLVQNGSTLEVRSSAGVRVLPQPVVDGSTQPMYDGFGPSATGRVVGIHPWKNATKTNAVEFVGASPPSIITALSTVMAMNDAGQIFGQLPGNTAAYGIVEDGALRSVSGLAGSAVFPVRWGNGGHLLYRDFAGSYLWSDGSTVQVNGGQAVSVNGDGVVLMNLPGPPSAKAALRFQNGRVQTVADLLGGMPAGWTTLYSGIDVNDDCDVLGFGQTTDFEAPQFLAHVEDCEAKDFDGNFFRVDNGPSFVKKDEDVPVRLRIENASGQEMTGVRLVSAIAKDDGSGGEATITQDSGPPNGTLSPNGPGSLGFVDFTVTGKKAGTVVLTAEVSGTKNGEAVNGTIESEFEIREDDLVVNLTLDPPEYEVPEDGVFEPTDITATVSFTNATNVDMTNIRLQDLDVARVFSGQELYVTYKSGIRPDPLDPEVIVPSLKAGATSTEFTAVFTATESGEVEFSALATAKLGDTGSATGLKKVRWKAKVKKYVEITTEVVNPPDGELIDAGSPVTINGTVENLSNAHTVTLGPLYPTLAGNTGTMNVGYDGNAPNPTSPVAAEPMVLEPGQKRTFQVRFTTNYSDPRMYEAQPSGGTRAFARFEPWGQAVEVRDPNDGEPEIVPIRTYDEVTPPTGDALGPDPDAQVLASPEALLQRISIDDSIEIPEKNPAAVAAGILLGAKDGLQNAAIAAIYSIPDLIKMPYTILVAAYDYQAKVWESFTDEEKDLFLTETSFLIVSVLQRNVEFGLKDGQQLYDDVYKLAGDHLTTTQNDWQTGDYLATTRSYSAFLSETIGSVAGPVLLTKMAQSPKAVAALERLQVAINARMASTFAAAKNVKFIDNVLPILQSIENGAEPTLTAIAKLWGVTPEEVAEYQRVCKIIGCLATIRSRHASSAEWIKKFGALLKPENLKIKSVSELDVMLGYSFDDLGSVIFRKPEILKTLGSGATKDQIKAEARRFAAAKGFKADTKEFTEAVSRLEDRVGEWNKYEKSYKQWNDRGWIDTTFNYEGNAIPEYRFDANGNVIGKLTGAEKGNFKGFKMVEKSPGSDEYVIQMLDGKTGKFRRVTGDIDPVDFTYTDGSPLSPEDHARLVQLLRESPLGAEHGYTSTFQGFKDPKTGSIIVKPGPELVKKQFKPNEPALQIAPEGAPRATRIDVENSRWVDAYNYNMRWVNGFVDVGTGRGRGAAPAVNANFDVIPLDAPAQIVLPLKTRPKDPTVGRFIIKHANKGDTAALIMGQNGLLQKVLPDGSTEPSELHEQAFSEGDTRSITIAPATTLTGPEVDPAAQLREQSAAEPSGTGRFGQVRSTGAAMAGANVSYATAAAISAQGDPSLLAGSDLISVSSEAGLSGLDAQGFTPGQVLALGVDSPTKELVEIASVEGDQLTLVEPLSRTHSAGEVVVMVVSADGVAVDPDAGLDPLDPGTDPTVPTVPTDPATPGTDTPGTGAPGTATPVGAAATPGDPSSAGVAAAGATAGSTGGSTGANSTSGGSSGQPLALTGTNSLVVVLFALLALVFGTLLDRRRRSLLRPIQRDG